METTIQEILTKLDIEFIEEGGHHHARPGWIQIRKCPFCDSDNFHLGFNLQNKYFVCWKCKWHHAIPTLTALGLSGKVAFDFFKGLEGVAPKVDRERAQKLVEPAGVADMLKVHKRYLEGRGFDPTEIATTWGVRGIGLAVKLKWRLYIPILHEGRQVSWTTRALGEEVTQRYISASAQQETRNHKEVVYGLDYCAHSVVIVEGPTDAWAVGPGAGALFGTAFSTAQVRLLSSVPYRYVCFDNSPPAQAIARGLAQQLSSFPGTTHNVVLDAADPGSATPAEIRALRRACKLQ